MKSLIALVQGIAACSMFVVTGMQAHGTPATDDNGISTIVKLRQQALAGAHDFIEDRQAFNKLMAGLPSLTNVSERQIDANGVPGEWISPDCHGPDGNRDVILYLHGGGFHSGSSGTHRMLAATLARDAQADVLLIDYRLMPEALYPAQIDDAVTSYRWLLSLGYPASRIALAGESAGGNLVLELALHLREAHLPLPASMVAMSPIVDLSASSALTQAYAKRDPVLQRQGLLKVAHTYMHGLNPRIPDASPLFADLHGLPPLLLQVGSEELLLGDSLRFAQVAAEDEIAVELQVWPGMVHQWQLFPTLVPDARRALASDGEFIHAHMIPQGEMQ